MKLFLVLPIFGQSFMTIAFVVLKLEGGSIRPSPEVKGYRNRPGGIGLLWESEPVLLRADAYFLMSSTCTSGFTLNLSQECKVRYPWPYSLLSL